MNSKKIVWGIVGPTASGKTALSFSLAEHLNGEIICMDSMQIYKGMDIGTAKPTLQEQSLFPHHLLDLIDPRENFTVAQYAECARPLLDSISSPILVGGTGLYLQALSTDSTFGAVEGDESLRKELHRIGEEKGPEFLHNQLKSCDPDSALKIHPNDIRRVIRALEVYKLTGTPFSKQSKNNENCPYDFRLFAIDVPRDILYQRINNRVDIMMKKGLLEEVSRLKAQGIPSDASSLQGLGYKELMSCLDGQTTLEDAVYQIKLRTRHFAKRQLTWFRRDERIHWLSWSQNEKDMIRKLFEIISLTQP